MTSTAFDLPDHPGSRAILIGTSEYDDEAFWPVPAVLNSLQGMREVLTDPALGGWPVERVTVMLNPRNAGRVATELRNLVRDIPHAGVLVLYYVGHGKLTVEGRLCLTVADTADSAPEYTGISYGWVAQALLESPARTKIIILDCCYSGHAIKALAADSASALADITIVEGVYTLTATTRNQAAHVPSLDEQKTAPTSFTGQLLDLIRTGIPDGPSHLAFADLYKELQSRLAARGLPKPYQRGIGSADRYPFTRNVATSPVEPAPSPSASPAPRSATSAHVAIAAPAEEISESGREGLSVWLWLELLTKALRVSATVILGILIIFVVTGPYYMVLTTAPAKGFFLSFGSNDHTTSGIVISAIYLATGYIILAVLVARTLRPRTDSDITIAFTPVTLLRGALVGAVGVTADGVAELLPHHTTTGTVYFATVLAAEFILATVFSAWFVLRRRAARSQPHLPSGVARENGVNAGGTS